MTDDNYIKTVFLRGIQTDIPSVSVDEDLLLQSKTDELFNGNGGRIPGVDFQAPSSQEQTVCSEAAGQVKGHSFGG